MTIGTLLTEGQRAKLAKLAASPGARLQHAVPREGGETVARYWRHPGRSGADDLADFKRLRALGLIEPDYGMPQRWTRGTITYWRISALGRAVLG